MVRWLWVGALLLSCQLGQGLRPEQQDEDDWEEEEEEMAPIPIPVPGPPTPTPKPKPPPPLVPYPKNKTGVLPPKLAPGEEAPMKAATYHYLTQKPYDFDLDSWSYNVSDGAFGPSKWPPLCLNGASQSPINLDSITVGTKGVMAAGGLPALRMFFNNDIKDDAMSANIFNNGHTLEVIYNKAVKGIMRLNDSPFFIRSFSVHSPAEHQIGGQTYDMEIQVVATNPKNGTVMLSVLMQEYPQTNAFLEPLLGEIPAERNTQKTLAKPVRMRDLFPKTMRDAGEFGGELLTYPYYTYTGSFTSPPCTEGIRWFVWGKPEYVHPEQLAKFKAAFVNGTARAVQPLGDRSVEAYTMYLQPGRKKPKKNRISPPAHHKGTWEHAAHVGHMWENSAHVEQQ